MTLAYLEWLSPDWGWALIAAAGVPLLAHLLSRRGGRLAEFPTVRFIAQATAECAKFLRPRHWLMLALRTLLAAAVVGAFARPVWFHQEAAAATDRRGVDAVMIVDASASMQRAAGGVTLFDEAKREAADAIGRLDPARDRACVILLDGSPAALLPEMTANFSELIARLNRATPTWQQGDLLAALQLATRPATPAAGKPQEPERAVELHLFSDMQATQWPAVAALRQVLGGMALLPHPVGRSEGNLALQSPAASPARPVIGQETAVTAVVANYSTRTASATLEMTFAGEKQTTALQVPARAKAAVRCVIRPARAGPAAVRWRLLGADDAFPADDQTGLYLDVAPARPVTLVTRADVDNPMSGAFYLSRALAPAGSKSDVELQTLQPADLVNRLAPDAASPPPSVVAIVEAGRLEKPVLEALAGYILRGGGVLWIADGTEAADSLSRLADVADGQVVSPIAPLAGPAGASWDFQADLPLAEAKFDDPILAVFEGPSRTVLLAQRFSSVMHGTLTPGSDQLLGFPRHEPALAARWAGAGRLAVLAAAIGPRQSELVKGPAFLPLVQQLLKGLAPGVAARPNPLVGSRPMLTLPGKWTRESLTALGPEGRPVDLAVAEVAEGRTTVEIEATPIPGPYEILAAGDKRLLAGVQVDLSPGESDMAAEFHPAGLDAQAAAPAAPGVTTLAPRPEGVELWPYFILAALALAAVEMAALAWLAGPWPAAGPVRLKEVGRA